MRARRPSTLGQGCCAQLQQPGVQHSHPAPPRHGTGGGAEEESQEVIVPAFGQLFAQLPVLLAGRSGRPLSEWFPRQDAAFFYL